MAPLVLLAACCVLVLVLTLSYLNNRNKHSLDEQANVKIGAPAIPGPELKDDQTGNLAEIDAAGSLHHFLLGEHMRHGPVFGFWMGKLYVVSVASPDSFKKLVHIFDRPPALFQLLMPLITEDSIQLMNYEEGRARRQMYDRAFSHSAMNQYYKAFQRVTDEVVAKWSFAGRTDHLPVHRTMMGLALKSIAITAFGEYLNDDCRLAKLQNSYSVCWGTMEYSLTHGFPEKGSERHQQFKAGLESIHALVKEIITKRRSDRLDVEDKIFFDYLIEFDDSEDRIFADVITYFIGGFHNTGNLLTWALYYLARDQTAQAKLAYEIKTVLGDLTVNETNISELKYLRQVQDETMRCSVLTPWAAKCLDKDIELEGYIIPTQTPIITSLGVMLQDANYWPEPERFDPERFNQENNKKRPAHVFSPFGLAGKRICPGYRLAYSETAVVLATLVRKFRWQLINDHEVKANFGLLTTVSDEVWVSLTSR